MSSELLDGRMCAPRWQFRLTTINNQQSIPYNYRHRENMLTRGKNVDFFLKNAYFVQRSAQAKKLELRICDIISLRIRHLQVSIGASERLNSLAVFQCATDYGFDKLIQLIPIPLPLLVKIFNIT
jgi:hypothetical protein